MSSFSTASPSASAPPPSTKEDVVIRPLLPNEVEAAAILCVASFKAFNDSVGLPPEFEGDVPPIAMMEHSLKHPDIVILGVFLKATNELVGTNTIDFRCPAIGAIGPIAVAPERWHLKIGRALMEAALAAYPAAAAAVDPPTADASSKERDTETDTNREEARRARRDSTKVENSMLMQVSSNPTSFSLYARLGFRPVETCLNFSGLINTDTCPYPTTTAAAPLAAATAASSPPPYSYSLRPLQPADATACDALFQRACGEEGRERGTEGRFCRLREIEEKIKEGGKTVCGLRRTRKEGKEEELCAYSTGCVLGGHVVTIDEEAFKVFLWEVSRRVKEGGREEGGKEEEMNFYFQARLYPGLLPWLFAEAKFKLARQTSLMGRGPGPFPAVSLKRVEEGMVYCPSICF